MPTLTNCLTVLLLCPFLVQAETLNPVAPFSTAYFEAERFTGQTGGNRASSEYFPYIGEGYLEMGGEGATVTWNNITVPKAGKYTLILKYANSTNQDRPCDLKVNGEFIKTIPFGPFKKTWATPWPAATEYNAKAVGWAKYWNARVIVDLEAGTNTLELIATSAAGGPHIDNIGVSTALSEPPAPVIKVNDHGAVGDGSTDNTEAIAKAIAACPVGGSVVFDEGIYMTGSITLKSNMALWVSEGAVIRAIQDNDLTFNRINMNNVHTPMTLLNGGGLRSQAPGVTTMKDITISNLEARNVYDPMGSFITGTKVGDTVHKAENINLTNVKVSSFKGGLTKVPGTPVEYDGRKADVRLFGNFPAWAYYIRHAENVVFTNVTHDVSPEDVRQAIVLEDVTGFENGR